MGLGPSSLFLQTSLARSYHLLLNVLRHSCERNRLLQTSAPGAVLLKLGSWNLNHAGQVVLDELCIGITLLELLFVLVKQTGPVPLVLF